MLEKLNQKGYETISIPSEDVICQLERLKKEKKGESVSVAEVGIGIGATAVEIVKRLDRNDSYYLFSFQEDVSELKADLEKSEINGPRIFPCGNTHRVYDSYVWGLAELLRQNRKNGGGDGLFDLTYLDGAHTLLHDGLACCLLKKLTKPGGVVIVDDINWSFAGSPTANPEKNPKVLEMFTEEELKVCQVGLAVELLLAEEDGWERMEACSRHRAVFKRLY